MSILASGPLMFSEPNCPTRVGEMVETVNDLYNISSPREGMQVFVKAEKKTYVITSLKEKVVNGVSIPNAAVDKFELMGDTDVVWSAESNMNDYTESGVYNITGERTVSTDNLPIANTGGGHTFDAKLFVLDSSIPGDGKNTDKCVTQILTFSNRVGGDGNVYIRTGRGASEDNLTWEAWSALLKNKNVGAVTTLDDLIDNGVYSGVFVGDYSKPHETFILVVINDYQVAVTERHVSQFYYSVDSYTGETTYNTRTGSGTPIKWSDWHYVNYLKIQKDIEDLVLGHINTSISELIGTAPETLDTIHEIASWIVNDKTGAAAMAQQIESLGNDIVSAFELINEETNNRTVAINSVKSKAVGVERFSVSNHENDVDIVFAPVDSNKMTAVTIPAATTEKAGVMTAEDKVVLDSIPGEIDKIKDGDTIVGQTREIHSRNGKTVSDSFLARTTAGSGTIGDGVASLKSVGGNIVKNLISQTAVTATNSTKIDSGSISIFQRKGNNGFGFTIQTNKVVGHKYYFKCFTLTPIRDNIVFYLDGVALQYLTKGSNAWIFNSVILTCQNATGYTSFNFGEPDSYMNDYGALASMLLIDITEMFGAGKEPTKEECDRMFGTMDALPQGLTISQPTEFKSTGFNQFNPENVLDSKAIVDNAIVSGDKKIAVIPCLPCKVGVGENNGYCIHGDFGDDIKVYLTPLNPLEIEGELYMHELIKDATTDTYVPQIKGYMLVEVPTTANLCAHFLWSEDKCERDSYEPYFESKIELPVIPQMSEWGLAGIQSSGTLVADTIDFERGVYIKRIGCVDLGSLSWIKRAEPNFTGCYNAYVKPTSSINCCGVINEYVYTGKNYVNAAAFNDSNTSKDKIFSFNTTNALIYLKNTSYADAESFKASLQGVMLYYELAEPEEYPLPKVDNNYISSDYGVEQFDSAIPCNANNLYYMRSLAGETRNFLDRLYDNTDKTDAKEVADYITDGIESNKPNLALRALYVAAGAIYNGSTGYYELNGITDLTESDMSYIYEHKEYAKSLNIARYFQENKNVRTIYPLNCNSSSYEQVFMSNKLSLTLPYYNCNIEVLKFSKPQTLAQTKGIPFATGSMSSAFSGAQKLKTIYPIDVSGVTNTGNSFSKTVELVDVRLIGLKCNVAFNDSVNLSKESVLYIIQNAIPTSAITVTLHADAYARLVNDADIVAALEAQPLITLVSA